MSFRISGQVRERKSLAGIPNLIVSAYDKDLVFDDLLGKATTNAGGYFEFEYEEAAFKQLFDKQPDIYLRVESPEGKVVFTSKDRVRCRAGKDEHFTVEISRQTLLAAGIALDGAKTVSLPEEFRTFTCLKDKAEDDIVKEIERDLKGKSSVLDLMKDYLQRLEGELDNNAPAFLKLAKLFECGKVPEKIEGHHYGLTMGIRSGDQREVCADYANFLGYLWSTSLGKVPPWVGKSFEAISGDKLRELTDGNESGDAPTYLGINHFNEIEESPLNVTSIIFLTFWMSLKDAPESERTAYGYEKNGSNFIAKRAASVYHATGREVLQLNYRWPELHNLPPLSYLIDELVEIADGLYFGQLLFATKKLFSLYDPELPDSDYGYEHFGYFLLMDERWKAEARRLFPYIGIPFVKKAGPAIPEKFTTFTFAEPADGNCNDTVLSEIREDMRSRETILDLLKFYSDELKEHPHADSPYFTKLLELFNRGIGPDVIRGYYRGALVSWNSEGFFKLFNKNVLNEAWEFAKLLSPWTGKFFEDISVDRLKELTGGVETGDVPTFWGSNTYSLRTTRKRLMGRAMKAAGIRTEDANAEEKRMGIDLKSFFFIGRQASSIFQENRQKKIYQFNYRWPKLGTFPPDNYCIDEIVQIAEGMYLGQLLYATELFKKYDFRVNPAEYKYRLFGYFLAMDEEWHARRLRIGFDLDNT